MTTLLPPLERAARAAAKRHAVLRHLRTNVYTSPDVIGKLLDLPHRQVIHRLLISMERDDLVKGEAVTTPAGRRVMLWGITPRGQLHAADIDAGEVVLDKTFDPGRVGLSVLQHTLDIQSLEIVARQNGWRDWTLGDRLGKWAAGQSRPDIIATHPSGERWAFEVERTIKTTRRYCVILADRLQAIRRGDFSRVVWLTPMPAEAVRLASLIKSITTVIVAGQAVRIDPERHHAVLAFHDFTALPSL